MEKIYGYKEKDVLGLAQFIRARKGGTLRQAFKEYAELNGKAQGTVRNLYYALAKKSNLDEEFCKKYLNGKPLSVGKIVEFDKVEEQELIKQILKNKLEGKSVRSIISELSSGDEKKALRYQNKYRNYIKNNHELVERLTLELENEGEGENKRVRKELVSNAQIKKLKYEINGLIEKISSSVKKENEKLKAKNAFLERENAKLKQELALKTGGGNVLTYFQQKDGNRIFN